MERKKTFSLSFSFCKHAVHFDSATLYFTVLTTKIQSVFMILIFALGLSIQYYHFQYYQNTGILQSPKQYVTVPIQYVQDLQHLYIVIILKMWLWFLLFSTLVALFVHMVLTNLYGLVVDNSLHNQLHNLQSVMIVQHNLVSIPVVPVFLWQHQVNSLAVLHKQNTVCVAYPLQLGHKIRVHVFDYSIRMIELQGLQHTLQFSIWIRGLRVHYIYVTNKIYQ